MIKYFTIIVIHVPAPASILILDDDQHVAFLFSLYLNDLRFYTNLLTEPETALSHFMNNHAKYSIVLLDWSMAKLDGIELAKKIRKCNSNVDILLLTGHQPNEVFQTRCFNEVKLSTVVLKPVKLEDLGAKIVGLVEKYKKL